MSRACLYGLGILCMIAGFPVMASLVVIYDSGDTQSIVSYLPHRPVSKNNRESGRFSIGELKHYSLPVRTPSMRSGTVTNHTVALPHLQKPLFLIGSDALSQTWLKERYKQLTQIGAVGLLIEAKDQQAVERMTALARDLPLIPSSAEGFASALGLTHYPVLLSNQGWEQ